MRPTKPKANTSSNKVPALQGTDSAIVEESVVLLSECGDIIDINTAGLKVFDAESLGKIKVKKLSYYISLADQTTFARLIEKARTGIAGSANVNLTSLKEYSRYITLTVTSLKNYINEPEYLLCVFRGCSHRRADRHNLLGYKAQFTEVQSRAKLGSWQRNLVTGQAHWSAEMYRIFGVDPIDGPPLFEALAQRVHPEDRERFVYLHDLYIREGTDYQVDVRLIVNGSDQSWIDARSETVRDDNGKAILLRGTAQDNTARKLFEEEILVRGELLAESQSRAKMGSWRFDRKTKKVSASKEMFRLVEQNPNTKYLDIKEFIKQVHSDDKRKLFSHFKKLKESVGSWTITIKFILNDGSTRWLEGFEESLLDANGDLGGVVGTLQDVTELRLAQQKLDETRSLLEASQSIAKLGGWEIDLRTMDVICTDEVFRILETTREEYKPSLEGGLGNYTPSDRDRLEVLYRDALKNGSGFDVELGAVTKKGNKINVRLTCQVTYENGVPAKLTGIYQDISEQKSVQVLLESVNDELAKKNRTLEKLANYDALTQLPNRVLLADRLEQAIAQCQRRQSSVAVAFLDLDGFKEINDRYGHAVGDKFLVEISKKMKSILRESDTFSRIGGDEFVAVITDVEVGLDCEAMIHRLLEAAANPIVLQGHKLAVTASIGVTVFPHDNVDAEQLLRHADQAMYLAKQEGKNQCHLFDVLNDTTIKQQIVELDKIRDALKRDEFVLYYQPKVNSASRDVIGVEALIRWRHPTLGLVPPADFLPKIQNHIFSVTLGEWVISTAINQLEKWQSVGVKTNVSVNIDAIHLQQQNFHQSLQKILSEHPNFSPQRLELEILETCAIDDIEKVSEVIRQVKSLGVTFALDDFGTGYSSLSYLKKLHVETIKIDQSFIRDMLVDPEDLSIVKGVIGIAHAFRRQVIAEGVETVEHCKVLGEIGCDLVQGYGIAKPMPADTFCNWLDEWIKEGRVL